MVDVLEIILTEPAALLIVKAFTAVDVLAVES